MERGKEERKEGRAGMDGIHDCPTHSSAPVVVVHIRMPVVVSIHSALTCWGEGLMVVGR